MIANIELSYLVNPLFNTARSYDEPLLRMMNKDQLQAVLHEVSAWPGYQVTPLYALKTLANEIGVSRIDYKDEGQRFELQSFKALGGAYAVGQLLSEEVGKRLGRPVTLEELRTDEDVRQVSASLTVITATAGNHGRSVAWGAKIFGCQCVIYFPEGVSEGRQVAIEKYGAKVVRTPVNYDQAVQQADEDAKENGWFVISDTSYEGYTQIPCNIMQGYQILVEEAVNQLDEMPTHIFVQAGVGGLAAAVCAYFWERLGAERPSLIVVEPESADCLYQSALNRQFSVAKGNLETIMGGLACGVPSVIVWDILSSAANVFCTIKDEAAIAVMRSLAFPDGDDPAIVAGESATAGLAAAIGAMQDAKTRIALGLDQNSRILVFGTEGATDAVNYQNLVGATADQVMAGIKLSR